ncbi:CsbD family protein [Pseudoclavibacter chungangensis]|uniref:CsbD family protein n=1 Tax=Pseudoclavibacter chungangensis TaxID=587635 RepID=A0A7J5C1C4_9MICO|nr:CsbD family protein [Pseudoclavibacter chungangensis]KAB1662427.1 CsbD family protein [Pseudoclavibacter chungangensis]NYJ68456.1 uncharacterized protein YjbJ (UPF0337 family) [Pseudoclavibacter chungangensis]
MALDDDIKHTSQDLGGRAKEAAGAVTNNDELKREGRADQFEAKVKNAVSDAADSVKEGVDRLKDKLS